MEATYKGKVRDIYDVDDKMVIVTSDRISAYDVVLPMPVKGKGIISTAFQISGSAAQGI
jgi:phosphoribosylaminoimidazole-succinocarboxamide synthase